VIVAQLLEGPTPDAPQTLRQNASLFGEHSDLEQLQEGAERRRWCHALLEGRQPALTASAKRWAHILLGGKNAVSTE
jgi:hypothetical protein